MDTLNIGHYRLCDHWRKQSFTLYNTKEDRVYDITQRQYEDIRNHMSLAACEFVEAEHHGVCYAGCNCTC